MDSLSTLCCASLSRGRDLAEAVCDCRSVGWLPHELQSLELAVEPSADMLHLAMPQLTESEATVAVWKPGPLHPSSVEESAHECYICSRPVE